MFFKAIFQIAIGVLLLSTVSIAADLVVITHLDNTDISINKRQLQHIFMGRRQVFSNGKQALPIDQINLRAKFYKALTGRSIAQINAYWARLRFSGRTLPPRQLSDDQSIIELVVQNPFAIAYIMKENVDETRMRVLLILE